MTAKILISFASLASIGFLVWLAYLLGFRGGTRISGEAELQALSQPYGGAQQFLLDANGAGAIALLHDGQLLAAKIVGDRVATRIFPSSALASIKLFKPKSDQNLGIELRFDDTGFSSIRVATMENQLPAWLDQLQPKMSKP
nr:hypothetical protein [Polymorphobacter sp.]